MKYRLTYALLAGIAIAASSCGGTKDAKEAQQPTLCVSIEPQRKILEELAGDHYQVVSLLATGANPEHYDPTVGQRKAANDAEAYFTTGHLPFEDIIASGLSANTAVIDTSEGIEIAHGTHGACHHEGHDHHNDADPHIWTSLRNGKIIATNMANALTTLDPAHAEEYAANLSRLTARLDSLDNATSEKLSTTKQKAFAVWHPSLSYYARDYGLHQIAVGQESKELSTGAMRAIIKEAIADSVKVFFFQEEYDSRQAQSLNKEIGSRLVTIRPLSYDWEQEIINVTDELAR